MANECIKKEGDVIHLLCAVCGKETAYFRRVKYEKQDRAIFTKTMLRGFFVFEPESAPFVDAWLKELSLAKLHAGLSSYVDKKSGKGAITVTEVSEDLKNSYAYGQVIEGLDSYCPQCDKIFCKEHYQVKEGGSYSGSSAGGICPKGHERTLYNEFHSC